MVVFTCAHCGESLQKPKVEKHYDTKCRNKYPDLCCVDCLKDFRGDEFKIHTKCVSEAERYGGKGYVAKADQNKGEKKQNSWIEIIQSVLDENTNLPGKLRGLLERVSHQPNTPRKKPKFVNFVKSMDHRIQMGDIERAWDLLSAKLDLLKTVPRVSTTSEASASNGDVESKEDVTPMEVDQDVEYPKKKKNKKNKENEVTSNGHEESNGDIADKTIEDNVEELALTKKERKEKKKKEKYEAQLKAVAQESSHMGEDDVELKRKGKKRKFDDAIEEPIQKSNGINKEISENVENIDGASKKKKNKDGVSEFDWTNTIITVVESKKKDIALKKLQKRVLTEYCVVNGVSEITERITKKFNKSLYKIQNLKIENDKVRLVTEDE